LGKQHTAYKGIAANCRAKAVGVLIWTFPKSRKYTQQQTLPALILGLPCEYFFVILYLVLKYTPYNNCLTGHKPLFIFPPVYPFTI